MKTIEYQTHGTCARQIRICVENETVLQVEFVGGCSGNAQGLSSLAQGVKAIDLIKRLAGIQCQNGTSCPDQLSKALQELIEGC